MAKIGEGHLAGMARKGLSELAQYLPAFNQAGQNIIEDQGVWPNATPGEIAKSRGAFGETQGPMTLNDLKLEAGIEPQGVEQVSTQNMTLDDLRGQANELDRGIEQQELER